MLRIDFCTRKGSLRARHELWFSFVPAIEKKVLSLSRSYRDVILSLSCEYPASCNEIIRREWPTEVKH